MSVSPGRKVGCNAEALRKLSGGRASSAPDLGIFALHSTAVKKRSRVNLRPPVTSQHFVSNGLDFVNVIHHHHEERPRRHASSCFSHRTGRSHARHWDPSTVRTIFPRLCLPARISWATRRALLTIRNSAPK